MPPRPTLLGVANSNSDASPVDNSLAAAIPPGPPEVHDFLKRTSDATTTALKAVAAPTSSTSASASASTTSTGKHTSTITPAAGFVPGSGSMSASHLNNQAFLALFAVLGAVMVVAALWFFFWAKNGGFHFQEGDWEDYKSTVLRRKGPDGKTLSNATKSTKLGGSTIAGTQQMRWARQTARSVISYDKKGRKGILGKRGWGKTHSVYYSDDFTDYDGYGDSKTTYTDDVQDVRNMPASTPQERPHGHRDRDVQEYKKEKPARVGGLNRVPDGSSGIGGLTNTDISDMYSDSDRPISKKERRGEEEKERAERRARTEAAKMERRWKKEAEEAAAALAREADHSSSSSNNNNRTSHTRSASQPRKPPVPAHTTPARPSASRARSASRSASPRKRDTRDFSYQSGPESEVLSTAYTSTNATSKRTSSSYYDAYRPRAESAARSGERRQSSSPTKKAPTTRSGGYRRGADSDLD